MDSQTSAASLVDLIFGKCSLVYGRDFAGKWEGMNLVEVKADWARELGGWLNRPQAIRHALENLPADRPPNVLQFRALCNTAPSEREPEPRIEQTEEQRAASNAIKRMALSKLKMIRGAA